MGTTPTGAQQEATMIRAHAHQYFVKLEDERPRDFVHVYVSISPDMEWTIRGRLRRLVVLVLDCSAPMSEWSLVVRSNVLLLANHLVAEHIRVLIIQNNREASVLWSSPDYQHPSAHTKESQASIDKLGRLLTGIGFQGGLSLKSGIDLANKKIHSIMSNLDAAWILTVTAGVCSSDSTLVAAASGPPIDWGLLSTTHSEGTTSGVPIRRVVVALGNEYAVELLNHLGQLSHCSNPDEIAMSFGSVAYEASTVGVYNVHVSHHGKVLCGQPRHETLILGQELHLLLTDFPAGGLNSDRHVISVHFTTATGTEHSLRFVPPSSRGFLPGDHVDFVRRLYFDENKGSILQHALTMVDLAVDNTSSHHNSHGGDGGGKPSIASDSLRDRIFGVIRDRFVKWTDEDAHQSCEEVLSLLSEVASGSVFYGKLHALSRTLQRRSGYDRLAVRFFCSLQRKICSHFVHEYEYVIHRFAEALAKRPVPSVVEYSESNVAETPPMKPSTGSCVTRAVQRRTSIQIPYPLTRSAYSGNLLE